MRIALTILVAAFVAAWADAQQTAASLTAAERLKQLQSNRQIVQKMVSRSIELAGANSALDRAVACRGAMADLALALDGAITAQDPNRVAELGDHLTLIVNDGLLPNIVEAKRLNPQGSAGYIRIVEVHKSTTENLKQLELSVPRTDALGRSNQVKSMLEKWKEAQAELAKIIP